MFDIEYKGGNTLIFSNKKVNTVIDPKRSVVGLSDLNVKDAVEIATEARFSSGDDAAQLLIEGPGEYEIGPLSIRGIGAVRHIDTSADGLGGTIYRIEIGDTRIALLGNISPKLDENQLEELGIVDVLVLPVGGGGYTLDATSAASLVRQIAPKIVVPTHYADPELRYEVPQDTLDTFVKELGAPVETTAKYKIKTVASLPLALTVVEITRTN